jgi:hypothetical protein
LRLSHKGIALFTGHGSGIVGSDAFNFGPMSGFTVAGITGDHAILVQEVQILIQTLYSAS